MLNIYYGRESINKEAFAFGKIKESLKSGEREVIVIVPDQYKLVTEKAAMKYMELPGLMGVEITSIRRLGSKIVGEYGIGERSYIDKYGRHIILSDIINGMARELKVYSRQGSRSSFIEMINNQISEFKRFGVTPDMLRGAAEGRQDKDVLLGLKLSDIIKIYTAYEKRIEGSYVDTEDRTNIFLSHIGESDSVKGKEIWVWGFDWFAPKDLDVLRELMNAAGELNMLFTYGSGCADSQLFTITGEMMEKLCGLAAESGLTYRKMQIGDEWRAKRDPAIAALERGIFALPVPETSPAEKGAAEKSITMVASANVHVEAESAAAYILSLVRDEGYRYRDIALICNDREERGEVIRQTFEEYGISLFVDRKRSILRHPAVGFLMSLIDVVTKGYRSEDVFAMLKTGLGPLSGDEVERLENYAVCYKIEGSRWKKSFTKANTPREEEQLAELESMREAVCDFTSAFEALYKKDRDAVSRTEAIYTFLKDRVQMHEKLQAEITELEGCGKLEEAAELGQVWDSLLAVMAQMQTVMGETKVSLERYRNLLGAGLAAVEVGILPPSADGITMDTMQRSRLGDIKALVIVGANEGEIPKGTASQSLLSDIEKQNLAGEIRLGKLSDIRSQEEKLAMYRVLSQPAEKLYISYASSGIEGEKLRPAELFNDIAKFLEIKPLAEFSSGDRMGLPAGIENPMASLRHLAEQALQCAHEGKELPQEWREVYAWCMKNAPEQTRAFTSGIGYRHEEEKISPETAGEVYAKESGDIKVSPSSLEKYSHCPFRFFVQTGLAPEERRIYEMASREVGEIYHECLERLMKELSSDGLDVNDASSRWQTATADEVRELTGKIFDDVARNYRSGLAGEGPVESYRARQMKRVICENAWAAVCHVRVGEVKSIKLEQAFNDRKGASYPSIAVPAGGGDTVRVTGIIDRIDTLKDGEIKIIDYKSGAYEITPEEIKTGWKLQLMLYLKAASRDAKPAGVFYYNINTKLFGENRAGNDKLSLEDIKAGLESEAQAFNLRYRGQYAMSGLLVNDGDIAPSIVGPARSNRDPMYFPVVKSCSWTEKDKAYSGKAVLSPEEFREMESEFDRVITELCTRLSQGHIEARPKRQRKPKSASAKMQSGCDYCAYHSICRFDKRLPGCTEILLDF